MAAVVLPMRIYVFSTQTVTEFYRRRSKPNLDKSGQVYNPIAISYVPGRDIEWYLRKAGGATPSGNKKYIYVLRADGSVAAHESSWTGHNLMNLRLRPGDSVFVPEKIIGGSQVWQNIIGMAQIMSVAALPIAISGTF
jgi:hypothetical protein